MPVRMTSNKPLPDNLARTKKDDVTLLYRPSKEYVESTNMQKFVKYIGEKYKIDPSYKNVHEWSINQRSLFWEEMWSWCAIRYSKSFEKVVDEGAEMIGPTEWFRGAQLNYAENILERGNNEDIAIIQFGNQKFI
jgi:acetoacetyl-CoA synthetase